MIDRKCVKISRGVDIPPGGKGGDHRCLDFRISAPKSPLHKFTSLKIVVGEAIEKRKMLGIYRTTEEEKKETINKGGEGGCWVDRRVVLIKKLESENHFARHKRENVGAFETETKELGGWIINEITDIIKSFFQTFVPCYAIQITDCHAPY